MSNDNLFYDLEQDNNPSFYGNTSLLNNPYNIQSPSSSPSSPDLEAEEEEETTETKETTSSTATPLQQPQQQPHTPKQPKENGKQRHHNSNSLDNKLQSPQLKQQQSTLQKSRQSSPTANPLSDNEYPNELVNSTIGLSNKITQLLDDPDLQIDIINSEKLINSSIIVYTIQLLSEKSQNKIVVKRRYSEFKSLRDNLLRLFPTIIVPPIPEKHSILSYLLNSINSDNEINIIEMRKRYFKLFLNDLIFDSDLKLKNCILLHKFFDPNYELCWYNALNEPPISFLPNNLLLANPVNPADQNGLYSILPIVNGFDISSKTDNLSNLKKINDELFKLNDQIKLFELKGFEQDLKFSIPQDLITFEMKFHKIIKNLNILNKLDIKTTKDYKGLINILIDLGGNLNNFSLQIYNQKIKKDSNINELSESIEKFGSTMDQSFLNFENFVFNQLIPQWQEPINQLIQYHQTSLNLIKFYKYKIIQFKILYKLKFNKFQQLININNLSGGNNLGSSSVSSAPPPTPSFAEAKTQEEEDAVIINSLDHLKELNSPTLNNALKNISMKKITKKSSWYGLFGGNNQPKKFNFQLPVDNTDIIEESNSQSNSQSQSNQNNGQSNSIPNSSTSTTSSSNSLTPTISQTTNLKFKLQHIEKELNKINQLIELCNNDMKNLTSELLTTFKNFLKNLEKKWLIIMINYLKNGRGLFEENLINWINFKESFFDNNSIDEIEIK
ncbi:SNX41 [Candida pseudojiufengensis]|uniref:SNX41 n=1 Tax=Candida pseudojiufengensis TaxID=497109 RepID=UPI0022259C4E|nr:SNX41 [Candida pseudojiufengensis]KAI5960663.1 SNX41 [Candida pseudojiufengensis]